MLLRAEGASFSAGLDRRMFPGGGGIPGERDLAGLAAASDAEIDAAIASFQEAFTWWRRPDLLRPPAPDTEQGDPGIVRDDSSE